MGVEDQPPGSRSKNGLEPDLLIGLKIAGTAWKSEIQSSEEAMVTWRQDNRT